MSTDSDRDAAAPSGPTSSRPLETPTGSPQNWGTRLSDALRRRLERGELAPARRMVLEGDGLARDLASEYTLMLRGLALTVRVLCRQLEQHAAAAGESKAAVEAHGLAHGFASAIAGPVDTWEPAGAEHAPTQTLPGASFDSAAHALDAAVSRFLSERARLAGEILEAIDARDPERALALLAPGERDAYLPLHDRIVRFMADSFAWALRHGGPEGLLAFHLETAQGQRAGFDRWDAMDAREFARASAFLLRQHMGKVEVREDDEKFTIVQSPCGSGGRLIADGAYTGEDALPWVDSAGPCTFGRPRLPVYCSHCPVWNGVAPLRWYGRPHWVFQDPARQDGGCTLHIHKRRDGAPAGYAASLGEAE